MADFSRGIRWPNGSGEAALLLTDPSVGTIAWGLEETELQGTLRFHEFGQGSEASWHAPASKTTYSSGFSALDIKRKPDRVPVKGQHFTHIFHMKQGAT